LLSHFANPGQSLDGHFPVNGPIDVPFEDIQAKFVKSEEIGRGGFGRVFKGLIYHTPCAIKIVRAMQADVLRKIMPTIRKEVEVMRRNNHPNIVGLLCVCHTADGNLYLIMPLMSGNLETYMKKNKNSLSPLQRLAIVHQILLGLNWLHSQNPPILHLDLKMENVLYDENYQMKLTDFGLSAVLADDVGYVEARLKTPGNVGHMSPEVIQRRKFDEKADVYSMGVLMWEIMKGCEWESEVTDQLKQMRISGAGGLREVVKRAVCLRGLRPSLEKVDWPESLKTLLKQMWALDPKERPTLSQVLERENTIRRDLLEHMMAKSMNDRGGKDFWLTNFSEDPEKDVPWGVFKTKFYSDFQLNLPANEADRRDPQVQLLLYLKLALNAIKSERVSLQRFASVVDAFGPCVPETNNGGGSATDFLRRVEETLKNRWFRPDLTQDEAKEFLFGQDEGTFVVRFSAQVGVPFTITRMKNQRVHQTRIYKVQDGKLRIGEKSSQKWSNVFFASLKDIMSSPGVVKAFNLKLFPVRRYVGPGEQLILAPLEDTNYMCEEGLNDSGVLDEVLDGGNPTSSSSSSSSFGSDIMFG